jgi:hypothetical protein
MFKWIHQSYLKQLISIGHFKLVFNENLNMFEQYVSQKETELPSVLNIYVGRDNNNSGTRLQYLTYIKAYKTSNFKMIYLKNINKMCLICILQTIRTVKLMRIKPTHLQFIWLL